MKTPTPFSEAISEAAALIKKNIPMHVFMNFKTSEEFVVAYHHTLGQTIRNAWGLWDDQSPLSKDIVNRFKVTHADDMYGIIFRCAWQSLNGLYPTPEKFAAQYIEYWRKVEEEGVVDLSITKED